jgi:hypothetical protein
MVLGEINGSADSYALTSGDNQYVTILVVPEYQLDAFSVTVSDGGGEITRSEQITFINWVQLRVAADSPLKITVDLKYSAGFWQHNYRLFVVGSTTYIPQSDMQGHHIKNC